MIRASCFDRQYQNNNITLNTLNQQENFFLMASNIQGTEQQALKRKRLNLDLTPEAYELLQKLADKSGKNMSEVLRTGLALYGIAQKAKEEGREVGVIEGDRVVREVVIPS